MELEIKGKSNATFFQYFILFLMELKRELKRERKRELCRATSLSKRKKSSVGKNEPDFIWYLNNCKFLASNYQWGEEASFVLLK